MKKCTLLALLFVTACSLVAVAEDTANTFIVTPNTFTVKNGAFPWHDRIRSLQLADVPATLEGAVLPQQRFSSRMLELLGDFTSATLGVSEKDLEKFKQAFPQAKETGKKLSVKETKSATLLPYVVVKLANPPQKIDVNPHLGSGLLPLKLEGGKKFQTPGELARTVSFTPPPQKEKLHLYLLMGQSNMVGRDTAGLESQTLNDRVGFLDVTNKWYVAQEPMHLGGSGIGPGIPFALEMLKRSGAGDCKIGLVPCAMGGTPLSRWEKRGDLYKKAMARAKAALSDGVLMGVLWHQGESDCSKPEDAETYGQRLTQMFQDLRADLDAPKVPIVVGQLGNFVDLVKYPHLKTVQAAIRTVPQKVPRVGYADSQGLMHKGDSLHFSADAEREFARRYADAMEQLQKHK